MRDRNCNMGKDRNPQPLLPLGCLSTRKWYHFLLSFSNLSFAFRYLLGLDIQQLDMHMQTAVCMHHVDVLPLVNRAWKLLMWKDDNYYSSSKKTSFTALALWLLWMQGLGKIEQWVTASGTQTELCIIHTPIQVRQQASGRYYLVRWGLQPDEFC